MSRVNTFPQLEKSPGRDKHRYRPVWALLAGDILGWAENKREPTSLG
jgi:hypothetical protein